MTPDPDNAIALERSVVLADNNQSRLTAIEVIDDFYSSAELITRHAPNYQILEMAISLALDYKITIYTIP